MDPDVGMLPSAVGQTDTLARCVALTGRAEPELGAVVDLLALTSTGTGPLDGTVLGVKELIAVAGTVRGCGAPQVLAAGGLDAEPQARDATVVARARAAGTAVLGTTASHALAYGAITPQTRNPVAPDRIAGGSSGGSAAALAAGLIDLALGTDTGGSVRIPAACCGVVGLKPTRGLIPLTGIHPLSWTLDTVGPMANTVADVATLLGVLAGPDPSDPVSSPPPAQSPGRRRVRRVGVPRQLRSAAIDPEVRAVWETILDRLARTGVLVVDVDLPLLRDAPGAAAAILGAEAAAVHGATFGRAPEAFPASVAERLAVGLALSGHQVAAARRTQTLLRAQVRRVLAGADVLVTPTLPCRVPPVGADEIVVDGVRERTTPALTRLTNPWNLAGVPAGSVPAGSDDTGAPIGIQVIGPWWGEDLVLDGLRQIEALG